MGWLPLIGLLMLAVAHRADAAGDPEAGAQVFRTCAACHTLEPGVHRTGPSLAGAFGREAGTAAGFHRYSDALRSADLIWREDTLNDFLADPQAFLPGNRMTFAGLADAQARADVIAYLQTASAGGAQAEAGEQGGMMAPPQLIDLRREIGPNNRITSIRYCGDTYIGRGAARVRCRAAGRTPRPSRDLSVPWLEGTTCNAGKEILR
jgi:cytochrome c